MVKIAVGGCSFSDRRYGVKPYGDQVAEYYGVEYIHEAASAGSNYRIWRTLTAHILNKNLVKGDVIIVQYTLLDRSESWTPVVHDQSFELEKISEPYDGGTLVRLTPHFDQFAKNRAESQLAYCHNYFSNHKLNLERFWTGHSGFAALCELKGITVRYLNTRYDHENRIEDINGLHLLDNPEWLLDNSHMNQLGHDHTAQLVIDSLGQAIGSN